MLHQSRHLQMMDSLSQILDLSTHSEFRNHYRKELWLAVMNLPIAQSYSEAYGMVLIHLGKNQEYLTARLTAPDPGTHG